MLGARCVPTHAPLTNIFVVFAKKRISASSIKLNPAFYQPRRELALYYLREARLQFMEGIKIVPQSHPFSQYMKQAIQWIGTFLGEGQPPKPIWKK